MIVSFNHKGLEKFFNTGSTAGIQARHVNKLRLQLTPLNEAQSVEQMNSLAGDFIYLRATWQVTGQLQ